MLVRYLTKTAEDESNLIRNIQVFLVNCVINMHSLFGITFVLFLYFYHDFYCFTVYVSSISVYSYRERHYVFQLIELFDMSYFLLFLHSNIAPFTCYFKELPAIDLRSEDTCAKQRYYTRSFRMKNVDDV